MFRGRVRKYALSLDQNLLVENSDTWEEEVRFAIPTTDDPEKIIAYITKIIPTAIIELTCESIPNPVLSKIKVNDETRYTL